MEDAAAAAAGITPRQIWAKPTTTKSQPYSSDCTPFVLPSAGVLFLNLSYSITLSDNAIYEPACTGPPTAPSHPHPVLDTSDPFYSSLAPQLYTVGCATIVSYLLVIILFITPRTFYLGGPGGGASFLGRHGMISGSYTGNSSVVGIGGRPWLQKIAASLAAMSLTIASVLTFQVAEEQYDYLYSDAAQLTASVIDGMEIRICRVITSTFLWLAQVQTLIRLFPRHKEKIMIKWAGFALIVLETIFVVLDSFWVKSDLTEPRLYEDAISALAYLFEVALSLLYAAWVIFYSLSKHRFAFFHPKMRNICLVALLSFVAVLTPAAFFVLDIAKPDAAGWGMYVRWVGSTAASVVVWEWVERIEALERDERKDGILGREVFDGDDLLDITPSEEVDWPRPSFNGRNRGSGGGGGDGRGGDRGGGGGIASSSGWGGRMNLGQRPLRTRVGAQRQNRNRRGVGQTQRHPIFHGPPGFPGTRPTPPLTTVTPVSRDDTTSAASTVYNVRYHPVSSPTPPVVLPHMEEEIVEAEEPKEVIVLAQSHAGDSSTDNPASRIDADESNLVSEPGRGWRALLNPFRRRGSSLPREVAAAQAEEMHPPSLATKEVADGSDDESHRPWAVRSRLDRLRSLRPGWQLGSQSQGTEHGLPVTVIPSRNRGQQTWTPPWFDETSRSASLQHTRDARAEQQPHPTTGHPNLPVRVIPLPARRAAPWDTVEGGAGTGSNLGFGGQELRYDPDAAALVVSDGVLVPQNASDQVRGAQGEQSGHIAVAPVAESEAPQSDRQTSEVSPNTEKEREVSHTPGPP